MTQVRLEPAALRSRVKHSTTEPLRSLLKNELISTKGKSFFGCQKSTSVIFTFFVYVFQWRLYSFVIMFNAYLVNFCYATNVNLSREFMSISHFLCVGLPNQ